MSMVILKIYCIVLLLYFKAGKLGSDMNLLPRIILKRFLVVRASHSYKLHMSLPSLYGLLHTTITTIVTTIITTTIITITPISTLSPQPWPPSSSTFSTNAFISTLGFQFFSQSTCTDLYVCIQQCQLHTWFVCLSMIISASKETSDPRGRKSDMLCGFGYLWCYRNNRKKKCHNIAGL